VAVKEHHIKIAPPYFNAVLDGTKKAELSNNDRAYKVGDVLSLVEYAQGSYTGREWAAVITHILPVSDVIPDGGNWVVLSIKAVNPSDARNYLYFGYAL